MNLNVQFFRSKVTYFKIIRREFGFKSVSKHVNFVMLDSREKSVEN